MACGPRLLAHMNRQRLARPQFGGIAQFFGLGASQMHYPSLVGAGNDRFFGTMESVLESGFDSHFQSLMQAMINGDSADPKGSLDSRRVLSGAVLQKNPRPVNLTHPRGARSLQRCQSFFFLRSEGQSWEFGFSGHAPNCSMEDGSLSML